MIILTDEQEAIVQAAIRWYKYSSSSLFQFAGNAGTGKSVVLNAILERLGIKNDYILPMAFTGQAAIIMRQKGISNACTCHSALFEPVQEIVLDKSTGKPLMDKQFNVPIVRWKFVPKSFKDSSVKLIIIDEAWMVPKSFKKFIDDTGIKVIATGDPGQLPPVGDEPAYLLGNDVYMLTKLMRQAENSPIVYLANKARMGQVIEPGMYGDSVLVIYDDELNDYFISNSNIVLCGKNETREFINNKVRNDILKKTTDYPTWGERLICRKNNWALSIDGIPLVNGLVGTVCAPPDIGNFDGEQLTLNFLPDLLYRPFEKIRINYKYLNSSYKEKEFLKNSPYLKGERFEYAYASTVHLSQGSEYPCGTYIEEYMRPDIQSNLNYTAITRFKKQMVYVKHKPKYFTF